MSRQGAAEPSARRLAKSDQVVVEIHVFECGQGDTILLGLPQDRWFLVDCNLPVSNGVRERFFQFVQSRGIERLDFIFQTHPDSDHFHGMIEVLDYFTSGGRSVGGYCDGGITAEDVRDLIWAGPQGSLQKRQYGKLHDRLDKFDDSFFSQIDAQSRPVSPKEYANRVDIIPVGPDAGLKRRITRSGIRRVAGDSRAKVEANKLSVVLVLSIREGDQVCNVLLAADADVDCMELALDAWEGRARETSKRPDFDVVKVPHHGSIKNHSERVYQAKRNDRKCCVAAVSAGHRSGLPDRVVLREYLDAGWTVLATTTRSGAARGNRPSELADRSPPAVQSFETHTITITVSADGVVAHGPAAALVQTGDLVLYGSSEQR